MNYERNQSTLAKYVAGLLDVLLPPRCPKNGTIVERNGALSAEAWRDLTFITEPFCACCGFPFDIVESSQNELSSGQYNLCGPCLADPKPFSAARTVFAYNDGSRDLILAFKHGDRPHLTTTFTPLLAKTGKNMLEEADLIVPVPLYWLRLARRRYNQSALLGRSLSRLTEKPFNPHILKRIRHTPPQGHKKQKDRHANVRGAFALGKRAAGEIEGKKIILIDDVYTTGATICECARVLLAGGAARVDVLALARVVKPH